MTESEPLDQEGVFTEDVCGLLGTCERCDGISLETPAIRRRGDGGTGNTHRVSNDDNWVLELLRDICRNSFNTTDGPSV